MKHYVVITEYYDQLGHYEVNYKYFNNILLAKLYLYLQKDKEYEILRLEDITNKKTITKLVKK